MRPIEAADELGIALQYCQKAEDAGDPQHGLFFAKRNEDLFAALSSGAASVGGGTAWLGHARMRAKRQRPVSYRASVAGARPLSCQFIHGGRVRAASLGIPA
jgi:hypothetical protein